MDITSPAALINEVQLNVSSQSSFREVSITSMFVTGAGPIEKNPTSAESSISIEISETMYIVPHNNAMATEQVTIIVLRHSITSANFPQNMAPNVTARLERNRAIATSRTCPPIANM